jgi:DNA-binding phage protein
MVKISKFDAADYLKTPEAIAVYLAEAFATDDAAHICAALDTLLREPRGRVDNHLPSAISGIRR